MPAGDASAFDGPTRRFPFELQRTVASALVSTYRRPLRRTPAEDREWEWNMSDPRYSDSRRNDELPRYGVQGPDGAGFWPWLTAALTALGLLIGGHLTHLGLECFMSRLNRARPPRPVRPHRSNDLRLKLADIPAWLRQCSHQQRRDLRPRRRCDRPSFAGERRHCTRHATV
jgi:hypothetical protein